MQTNISGQKRTLLQVYGGSGNSNTSEEAKSLPHKIHKAEADNKGFLNSFNIRFEKKNTIKIKNDLFKGVFNSSL